MTVNEKLCKNITLKLQATCFGYLLESPLRGDSNKYPKHNVLWGNKNKTGHFLYIILSIKDSLQQQIHFNGNILGNKCCCYNECSLLICLQCRKCFRVPDSKDTFSTIKYLHLSRGTEFPTRLHACPGKTHQISMHISGVWTVFTALSVCSQSSKAPSGRQQRLVRMCGCTDWSEFSLDTHAVL